MFNLISKKLKYVFLFSIPKYYNKFDDVQHKIIKIKDYDLRLKKHNILLILQRLFS